MGGGGERGRGSKCEGGGELRRREREVTIWHECEMTKDTWHCRAPDIIMFI